MIPKIRHSSRSAQQHNYCNDVIYFVGSNFTRSKPGRKAARACSNRKCVPLVDRLPFHLLV